MTRTDANGVPVLEKVSTKITTLERMLEYRQEKLRDGAGISQGVAGHYEREQEALQTAIVALRFHKAQVEGLDEPMKVLREMVEAATDPQVGVLRMRNAVRRAKAVLDEYGETV